MVNVWKKYWISSLSTTNNNLHADTTRQMTIFSCCRDGQKKGNVSVRKTAQTRQRSYTRKLDDGYCLARMTVTENLCTGAVTVFYIPTHTNHELNLSECKHLPLPKSVRTEVQQMLAKHIEMDKVLDGKGMKWFMCWMWTPHSVLYAVLHKQA